MSDKNYIFSPNCMHILQLVGRSAYDCKHRDGTVTVNSRASTGKSCLQSPLQFGPSKGPWVQIFERSTGSKTPLCPYMGKSPSGTRESWSWKMRSTCLSVGTTSPLKGNKFRVIKKNTFWVRFFTKSNYMPGNMRKKSLQKKQQIQCAPGPCYVLCI